MELSLETPWNTECLGRALAFVVHKELYRYVLCIGSYGVGKTTLIRSFVEALHNSDMAEISSPSFTGYNVYPTTPLCVHIDLYAKGASILDEVSEEIVDENGIFLIEWAESVCDAITEKAFLLTMEYSDTSRKVFCSVLHEAEESRVLEMVQEQYKKELQKHTPTYYNVRMV